jgi:hypothetical protein
MTEQNQSVQTEEAAAAAPQKPSSLTKMHKAWIALALFMVALAMTVGVVRTVVDNRATAIAQSILATQSNKPSYELAVIDNAKLVKDFREQGADEMRAYRALVLFLKILEEDGIIAIESKHAVTAPPGSMIKSIPYLRVEEIAKSRGVDIDKYQQDMIEDAQAQAEEAMRQLSEVFGEF